MKRVLFSALFLALAFPLFAQFTGIKPELIFYRHNSSPWGPLAITSTDTLGTIKFDGLTAGVGTRHTGASIRSFVTGPVSAHYLPANLVFRTGGDQQRNRMVITAEGLVGIGTMTPQFHLHTVGNTHTTGDFFGRIHMDNNQSTDDAPNTYIDEVYFERKLRTVLGVPAGPGDHGGLMTLAPGATGNDHQLFFGNDGIFTRRKTGNAADWTGAAWHKLLSGEDINGTPNRIAKFTGPNSLGNSQLWDDGTAVGIGTTTPLAGNLLDVNGNTRINGSSNITGSLTVDGIGIVNGAFIASNNATVNNTLQVNSTSRLQGNVGIGTAPTTFRLDVNGDAHLNGPVAIGTTATPGAHLLYVGGSILAEEVKVELQANWPDYVFQPEYKLTPLSEVKTYVENNRHLPGIPSAAEIQEKGLSLGETQRLMMEKIEELYLHLMQTQERLEVLEKENAALKSQIRR